MTPDEIIAEALERLRTVERRITIRKEFWGKAYKRVFGPESRLDDFEVEFLKSIIKELAL